MGVGGVMFFSFCVKCPQTKSVLSTQHFICRLAFKAQTVIPFLVFCSFFIFSREEAPWRKNITSYEVSRKYGH